jgi:hypothetical protein
MTHLPVTKPGAVEAHGASLTDADRALVLAFRAWSEPYQRGESAGTARDWISVFRERLAPDWYARLCDALEDFGPSHEGEPSGRRSDPAATEPRAPAGGPTAASQALERLRLLHRASARVDLCRVHPSWLVRALREESPTVQRLVAASAASFTRDQLQSGLLLDSQDLISERAPAPDIVSWVMALWTERLVGGETERADDPPAIILLSQVSPRSGYRVCWMVGLCKLILAGQQERRDVKAPTHARREWLGGRLAAVDGDCQELAKRDVEASRSSGLPLRRQPARIGLTTIARLLSASEPFRVRWALQHWPYPIAKLIRALMPPAPIGPTALFAGELLILRTAWERLNLEGRLALEWPLPPGESGSDLT